MIFLYFQYIDVKINFKTYKIYFDIFLNKKYFKK